MISHHMEAIEQYLDIEARSAGTYLEIKKLSLCQKPVYSKFRINSFRIYLDLMSKSESVPTVM